MSAIVDKIKKLLELSRSPNENEAASAAARVAELMAKHEISAADLDTTSDGPQIEIGRIDSEGEEYSTRYQSWKSMLGAVCAGAVGAMSYQKRHRADDSLYTMTIIGPVGSVNAARYLYMWLLKEVRRISSRERNARGESDGWRTSFRVAMIHRLNQRMQDMRRSTMKTASTTAMVRVDATAQAVRDAYEKLQLGKARGPRVTNGDGWEEGIEAGDRVRLGDAAGHIGEGQKKLKG